MEATQGAAESPTAPEPGDVVVLNDGSLAVVCLADAGNGQLACLELDELGNLALCGDEPEIVITDPETVHRTVGRRAELSGALRTAIESLSR